jgi:hypothetical protein
MSFESLPDDHTPQSTEVFLDTSIYCSRLKGSLFHERIARVLDLFSWKSTSSYTKTEYGNVVLSQAEYFLRKIDEFGSLERTVDFVANVLSHQFHPQKVVWAFNLLRGHYGADDVECTERALLSLRRLMKLGLGFVEEQCDRPIENGTDCYWARIGVHKRKDGRLYWKPPECHQNRRQCRLDEFFTRNKELFVRIKDAIDAMPEDMKTKQLQGFSEVIGEAMDDPAVLLDYHTGCIRLADAIIAVDGQNYGSMFSQNRKESELLTRVLGQAFYYLPPNPAQDVLVQKHLGTLP